MDESSDVDNSLTDPHHGLDSSFDENIRGLNKQEFATQYASASMDSRGRDGGTEDQMSMLQDMVLEMKTGFQTALKELAKIQDKEEKETNHSKNLQQQQQRQLDDLTETIHEIKNQLSSLTKNVHHIKDEQKTLKDHLEEVRCSRGSLQECKTRGDRDRLGLLDDFSASQEEWNTKLSELTTELDDHSGSNDDDVAAIACKSLTLAQTLSEKCLRLNLSQSSDEDEEHESRRVSHYKSMLAGASLGQTENRRHSMPASAAPQGRAKDVGSAAQRQNAVKDLADSERDYCSQLWSLLHTYLTPLKTAGFLSSREIGMLFPPYLDQLYAEHCYMCTSLQDRLVHWTYMGAVADLLARITDSHNSQESVLSLYREYVDDLLTAVTCLRRVQAQSSEFRSFLKAIKHSSCQSEDLMSLLLAPVQHIPKYLLQLQQVFLHTPPTHPDFPLLQTSLRRLRSFVNQLNEEVSITIRAINRDRNAWSGSNNGQVLSARDSGIHSNSTEDDIVTSAKAFPKAKRSYMRPEWLEDPLFSVSHRQRHVRGSASRLSALSQPDLTVYDSLNNHSSDLPMFAHIPRSRSTLPSGVVDSGEDITTGRQYRKFKIKRRTQSPVDYAANTKSNTHRSLSPHVRPSSAIDFLNQSHHHQQYHHHNNYRDLPVQSRKLVYPERLPRPLGSHATDASYKPTITSRKHLRQSQPPIPTSTNFWAETTSSSTVPFQVRRQRVSLSACDLLPKQHSQYNTSNVLDGNDEEEEDDTRASDTHSLGTSGSYPCGSGQGSNNGHDLELDFYEDHSRGHRLQTSIQSHNPNHSAEFSSAEVTASLARKFCDIQQTTANIHENLLMRQASNDVAETKTIPVLAEQSLRPSRILSSQVNGSDNFKEQQMFPNNSKISDMLISSTKSEHNENSEKDSQNTLTNESIFITERHASSSSKAGQNAFQKRDKSLSFSSNVSKFLKNLGKMDGSSEKFDETKHISDNKRLFPLPFSTRAPSVQRVDQKRNFSVNSNTEIHSGNLSSSSVSKENHTQSNSNTSTSPCPDMRSDHGRAEESLNLGSSPINEALILNSSLGVPNSESFHLQNRQSQLLSSHARSTDGDRVSSGAISLTFPQRNLPDRSHVLSSSNVTYPRSLSVSSQNTSQLNKVTSSSLDSHQFDCKPTPLRTSSTRICINGTAQVCGTAVDNGVIRHVNNYNDLISYPDSQELPPLEVDDPAPDGDKGGKKGDLRKKMKDGGKFNVSDGLPKTSDDPVAARKRMHFKSSIKNLFSKKKGQVILADVEKEVAKEMATAATDSTATSSSSSTTNTEHSRNTKVGNLVHCHPIMTCTPQKGVKESACETRTWKGQYDSNYSPVRVSKKFHFKTKQDKPQSSGNSKELSRNVLECLKTHNKRHGIVIDSNDTQFTNTLDIGVGLASPARQDNGSKGYFYDYYQSHGKNGINQLQPFQLRLQSDPSCGMENGGAILCNKPSLSYDRKSMPQYYQSQTFQKQLAGLRNACTNEIDLLKSTPDVCKNKSVQKDSKDTNEHTNISKNKVRSQKYRSQPLGEFHVKRSLSSTHDLCQQCQKCELKHKEKVVFGCEVATCGRSSGPGTLKICDPEVCEKNLCSSDKQSTYVCPDDKSEGSISDSTGHVSSDALLNDLNEKKKPLVTEKILHFPLADEHVGLTFRESFKPSIDSQRVCDTDKVSQVNSLHQVSYTGQQHEQIGNKSKCHTLSPVQKQTTSSGCQQCQSPNLFTHNMPDVTKISATSENLGRQNSLIVVSPEKSCVTDTADLVSSSDACPGESCVLFPASSEASMAVNSSSDLSTSLSDNCDGKTSCTASQSSTSLSRDKVIPNTNPSHYFSKLSHTVSSETRSNFMEQQRTLGQISRSRSTVLPQTLPSKECSQSFVVEETDKEVIVKHFSLEDKELFEHRYRLYFDNEASSRRNPKRLENPKSLKALSASSVIAGNFKQLPRDTNSGYDKKLKSSDQSTLCLTTSSSSDGLSERNQQTANNLSGSDSSLESKLTGVSSPPFSILPNTGAHLHHENDVPTTCNPHSLSQSSNYKSFDSGLMATSHYKLSDDKVPQISKCHTGHTAETNASLHESSNFATLLFPVHPESKETESSLKLYKTNKGLEKERNALSSDICEGGTGLHASSTSAKALYSDESSSYKPKNSKPVMTLLQSDASECQSSRCIRVDKSGSEYQPHFSLRVSSMQHSPISEQDTSGSSPNIASCSMAPNYNHESLRQLTTENGHRTNDDIHCSASYPCQQPENDSSHERSRRFLRTSSPSDLFSIRPYVDYTATKASSDSVILVHSDHTRSSTPNLIKSAPKGSFSEKLDKSRRHSDNRVVKNGSEKDRKRCKSPHKYMKNVDSSDDVQNPQPNYSRRNRYSDGVKLRAQEQKLYQSQYPRYSAESNSLISNAFLQKMAHLSQHSARSVPHLHADDGHLKSSTRHASIHGDLSRKTQGPNGSEFNAQLSNHSSRNFRITSSTTKNTSLAHSSSCATKDDISQMNCEHQRGRSSIAGADVTDIQASPDLLLSNDDLKEEAATTKEKSAVSKKAQSFFSKLAQSPLSFFYKDSKSSNPPK